MKRTSSDIKIGVRPETRAKYDHFASRRRLKLVEVADLAIDALNTLTREEQDRLIEGRYQETSQSAPAA